MSIIRFITSLLFVMICTIFSSDVYADELSDLASDSGIYETKEILDYDTARFLEENGISPDDPDSITKLSPKIVISYMIDKLKHSAHAPLRTAFLIISVILAASVSGAAADTINSKGTDSIYRLITLLTAVTVTMPVIEKCVGGASETIISGSEFMLCYVPVFAGISASSGAVTSAVSYNAVVLLTADAASVAAGNVLMPVVSVCMAMNIVGAANPDLGLSAVTELLKKWTTFLLGFLMTLFTGLLSIQSIVGVSADTLGVKAAKFVVSNFVPIVGSAVADAYATIRSGLGLLRGAAGAFGIIAVAVTILPPIIETGCVYLVMTAGEAVSQMFGVKELSSFFKGTGTVLSLIMAVLCCFAVMFIISTIILMAAGLNHVNV